MLPPPSPPSHSLPHVLPKILVPLFFLRLAVSFYFSASPDSAVASFASRATELTGPCPGTCTASLFECAWLASEAVEGGGSSLAVAYAYGGTSMPRPLVVALARPLLKLCGRCGSNVPMASFLHLLEGAAAVLLFFLVRDGEKNDRWIDDDDGEVEEDEECKIEARMRQSILPPRPSVRPSPVVIAAIYYANPFSILSASAAASPTGNGGGLSPLYQHLPMLYGLYSLNYGGREALASAGLCAGWMAYADDNWFGCLTLGIFGVLQVRRSLGEVPRAASRLVGSLALHLLLLHLLSRALVGNFSYVLASSPPPGPWWRTSSVTQPDAGLYWYFYVQIFPQFRVYYDVTFTIFPFLFVAPLAARLRRTPMTLAVSLNLVHALLRRHPALPDLAVALLLLSLAPRTLRRLARDATPGALACMPATVLSNVGYSTMWIRWGTGNANYLFFQNVGFAVFFGIVCVDFWTAGIKRDKALRLTISGTSDTDEHGKEAMHGDMREKGAEQTSDTGEHGHVAMQGDIGTSDDGQDLAQAHENDT
mmetsp:Transcript_20906/g.47460  ORF Transcript_20906/g.47460 Transcript_20906/m.47460 type:complete len:536 (-) Transcript_20906:120-1727(-)